MKLEGVEVEGYEFTSLSKESTKGLEAMNSPLKGIHPRDKRTRENS